MNNKRKKWDHDDDPSRRAAGHCARLRAAALRRDDPVDGGDADAATATTQVVDPESYRLLREDLQTRAAAHPLAESEARRLQALTDFEGLVRPKRLAPYPEDVVRRLRQLARRFPNAAEVLDQVIAFVQLSRVGTRGYAALPPMLLVGIAGSGKTSVAQAIAAEIAPQVEHIAFCATGEAFHLAGLDLGYSTGRPGRIAEILCKSEAANVAILADEFDKGAVNQTDRPSPYGVMYGLLEPRTSGRFEDIALRLELDCSHLSWIFTANDPNLIPSALLSRMLVFEIALPTRAQMPQVVRSVWADLVAANHWGACFDTELCEPLVDRLSEVAPREAAVALRQAAANAAARVLGGRLRERPSGPIALAVRDLPPMRNGRRARIGFIQ